MKHTITRMLIGGAAAGSVLFAGTAAAIDWNVTGIVRQEIAVSISSTENPNNLYGNPFNNRIWPHASHAGFGTNAGVPFAGFNSPFANSNTPTTLYVDPDGNALGGVGGIFSAAFAGTGPATPRGVGFDPGTVLGLPAGAFTANPVDCHYAYQRALAAGAAGGAAGFGPRVLSDGLSALAANGFAGTCGVGPGGGFAAPGTIESPNQQGESEDPTFNTFNTRLEVDVQARFNRQWSAYMKVRAWVDNWEHFTDADGGHQFSGGSFFSNSRSQSFWSGGRATISELSSDDAIIDIPAFYVDWQDGPLWVRLGNQTIAWGEAYFFRTTDVANGLDLRRHLTLGPGAEEYQDQRIASPGVRVSYTFNNGYEIDAFVQMFQPTVFNGPNTPYNLVNVNGARLDDSVGEEDAENAINFGAKLTMPLTDSLTGFVAYVNRRNPDGVFVNADSPTIWRGAPNPGCLNTFNDTLNVLANGAVPATAAGSVAGVNANLRALGVTPFPTLVNTKAPNTARGCGSAFTPDPNAPGTVQYWDILASSRINNATYLRNIVNDFPASRWAVRDIFGFGDEQTFADSMRTLEGFRSSLGSLPQWVGRRFKREQIFMAGGNYIISMDDPNSIFDQMIVRGEIAITPNKNLTTSLDFDTKEVDDVVSALILEKYHRISNDFPATYFVAQWMHRTSTDLFGRDLDMNDAPTYSDFVDPVTGNFTEAAWRPDAMTPKGTDNANYVVFAFQQPFPNLIWRFDMSVLVDVAGGYLVQPGLRYRPSADWQWDLYATIIESPGGDNDTITETIDWADEFFLRLTYFF